MAEMRAPARAQRPVYLASGLAVTFVLERWAIDSPSRWSYSELMPIVPVLGVGFVPLAQWLLLPPVALWHCVHLHAARPVTFPAGGFLRSGMGPAP